MITEFKEGKLNWPDNTRLLIISTAVSGFNGEYIELDVDSIGSLIAALQRIQKVWLERRPYEVVDD